MLTYQDCLGLCDLTPEEIAAIAQHEHLPEIAAAELGQYLVHVPNGVPVIRRMILDDIAEASRRNNPLETARLKLVLLRFVTTHPCHGDAS